MLTYAGKPDMSHEEQARRPVYPGTLSTNVSLTFHLLYAFVFSGTKLASGATKALIRHY